MYDIKSNKQELKIVHNIINKLQKQIQIMSTLHLGTAKIVGERNANDDINYCQNTNNNFNHNQLNNTNSPNNLIPIPQHPSDSHTAK